MYSAIHVMYVMFIPPSSSGKRCVEEVGTKNRGGPNTIPARGAENLGHGPVYSLH